MLYLSTLIRWLQRKRYQYEVTFSLYMMNPTEKIIFNTLALLFLSMIILAASLYLPGHVAEMTRRAWFYYAGDETVATNGGGVRAPAAGGGAKKNIGGSGAGKPGGRMDGQDVLDMLGTL